MSTNSSITKVAAILQARAGFRHDPALHGRLTRCLNDAADDAGREIEDYVAVLESDDEVLQRLVDRVTIQESSFFRDEAQFTALAQYVLPRLSATTIWSAGCANGQEAWTLAMVLAEQGRTDCSIFATDISTTALARAQRGWYSKRELRGLSAERIERFFVPNDGGYEVVPSLRGLVRFGHHNLANDVAQFERGTCGVAFCRNVLIYLTDDEIRAVLDRLASALGVGGQLFLGYSESLWRLPSRFALRRLGEVFVYEVEDRSAAPATPPVPAPRTAPRAARRPRPKSQPQPERETPAPAPGADEYFARGQVAAAARDLNSAVVAYRKAAYLRPDDAAIALHLAFALESLGDIDGARPWFRRSLEILARTGSLEPVLEGWSTPDLTRVLERKVSSSAGSV